MSERYLVTGVQLAMIQALPMEQERKNLIDEIVEKQWIANSVNIIESDVTRLIKMSDELLWDENELEESK